MNAPERHLACDGAPTDPTATYEIGADESVTEAVVTAMSAATDAEETELQPLYATIDPDALDALFGRHRDGGNRTGDVCIAFKYEGHDVQVRSDGEVIVY